MKENSERIKLGVVTVPEECKKWMKFVDSNGNVFAQPFVRKAKK